MRVTYALAARETWREQKFARLSPADVLVGALLAGACLNGFAVRVLEAWQLHGLDNPLLGISPFEILAVFVALRAILSAQDEVPASLYPELGLGVAMLWPSSVVAWFAIAAYALIKATAAAGQRRAGCLLLLAVAGCSIWSSLLLKWLAGPAAGLDAQAVGWLLAWVRGDIVVTGNVVGVPMGHNLIIMTACTSASGLAKAMLGLAGLMLLAGGAAPGRLWPALALAPMLSVAVNLMRLSLMASSSDLYQFTHGPIGANIFDATQTLLVVGLGLWAARS